MTDDRIAAGYDTVARTYDEQFADELDHKPLERGLLDAFCEMAPPGVIADIGCGPGHITRFLAERRDDVLGCDLSPEMIAIARRRNPRLPFVVASMVGLPCADGVWTGVVAMYSVIHSIPGNACGPSPSSPARCDRAGCCWSRFTSTGQASRRAKSTVCRHFSVIPSRWTASSLIPRW
jgi:SAM-dependent methyltransferase